MRYRLLFIVLVSNTILPAQSFIINNFDTPPSASGYWKPGIVPGDSISSIHISYDSLNYYNGQSALKLDWQVLNAELWGGLVNIAHWTEDGSVFDWSGFDSLIIWYNVLQESSLPNRTHLRLKLYDVSDAAAGNFSQHEDETEVYYSFHYILDQPPGWNRVSILLEDGSGNPAVDEWNGEAFNLTGWAGIHGNQQLDKDKIKGYGFEFAIDNNGSPGDTAAGILLLDEMQLVKKYRLNGPSMFATVADEYKNMIVWLDVPGQVGETYTIYYSEHPIDRYNINTDLVEVANSKIPENTESWIHYLKTPIMDDSVGYYYSMTCTDSNGFTSDPVPGIFIKNRAKGSGIIAFEPVFNFTADGLKTENWSNIPFIMSLSDGSATLVQGTVVDDDRDLSAAAFLNCDEQNLYVFWEINDDSVSIVENVSSWKNDSPELYIGLYDSHNLPHTFYQAGVEPDYHFLFSHDGILDILSDSIFIKAETGDYFWIKTAQGYEIEARIPFMAIAGLNNAAVYTPGLNDRIPIDLSINDADSPGERQGILTYSPYNQDLSWQDVSRWSFTWIYDIPVSLDFEPVGNQADFKLFQNYPNPFNATTVINYKLKINNHISLKIYDVLGREVRTLLNKQQPAGNYSVNFNASGLTSGIYYYRLEAGQYTQTRKMLLLR